MSATLTNAQKLSFANDGFLIVRDFLGKHDVTRLQRWAQEVHDWPVDDDSVLMPYAEINAAGQSVLCRTENFVDVHHGFNQLLRGADLAALLRDLAGEDMILFKEKINYKLAGSGGFAPHVDSTAYTHVKKITHLAVLIAIDNSDLSNGCLEVVPGSHEAQVPLGDDNCLSPSWVAAQRWLPVELRAGDILVFGSYLAHRSGPNHSSCDRKALYATYNSKSEGDLHEAYYAQRRIEYPPTHLRKPGERFDKGALRYGFGSPMISVDVGHQLTFA